MICTFLLLYFDLIVRYELVCLYWLDCADRGVLLLLFCVCFGLLFRFVVLFVVCLYLLLFAFDLASRCFFRFCCLVMVLLC